MQFYKSEWKEETGRLLWFFSNAMIIRRPYYLSTVFKALTCKWMYNKFKNIKQITKNILFLNNFSVLFNIFGLFLNKLTRSSSRNMFFSFVWSLTTFFTSIAFITFSKRIGLLAPIYFLTLSIAIVILLGSDFNIKLNNIH